MDIDDEDDDYLYDERLRVWDAYAYSEYEAYRDTRFGPLPEYIETAEMWYVTDRVPAGCYPYTSKPPNWVLEPYESPDGLDNSLARIVLEPHPELWEQWKSVVNDPDTNSRDRRRYYDVRYLRDVIGQYKHLTEGPGDPELSPEDEGLLFEMSALSPGEAFRRSMFLADPWDRAWQRTRISAMYRIESLYVLARYEHDPDSVTKIPVPEPNDGGEGNGQDDVRPPREWLLICDADEEENPFPAD